MQLVAYCFTAHNTPLNSFNRLISTYHMHSSHSYILWTQGNTSHQNVPSLSKSQQMNYAAWKIFPLNKLLFVTLLTCYNQGTMCYNQGTMCTEKNCTLGKIGRKIEIWLGKKWTVLPLKQSVNKKVHQVVVGFCCSVGWFWGFFVVCFLRSPPEIVPLFESSIHLYVTF